jgi:hypothetical protein
MQSYNCSYLDEQGVRFNILLRKHGKELAIFFCMFYLEAVDGKKSKRWMDRKNIIISFSKSINCSEVHSH